MSLLFYLLKGRYKMYEDRRSGENPFRLCNLAVISKDGNKMSGESITNSMNYA